MGCTTYLNYFEEENFIFAFKRTNHLYICYLLYRHAYHVSGSNSYHSLYGFSSYASRFLCTEQAFVKLVTVISISSKSQVHIFIKQIFCSNLLIFSKCILLSRIREISNAVFVSASIWHLFLVFASKLETRKNVLLISNFYENSRFRLEISRLTGITS